MAGHRKDHGRPSRPEAQRDRMQAKVSAAGTAWDQFAAAVDWFRMALKLGTDSDEQVLAVVRQETAHLVAAARAAHERTISKKVVRAR